MAHSTIPLPEEFAAEFYAAVAKFSKENEARAVRLAYFHFGPRLTRTNAHLVWWLSRQNWFTAGHPDEIASWRDFSIQISDPALLAIVEVFKEGPMGPHPRRVREGSK